jgi:hypothetical protein
VGEGVPFLSSRPLPILDSFLHRKIRILLRRKEDENVKFLPLLIQALIQANKMLRRRKGPRLHFLISRVYI